jgi:putative aminopeptidase FrvX
MDGVAGAEGAVLDYIRERVGGEPIVDNTGSLTVSFGDGAPHTLIIAGLDEPGFVISGITEDGFLRLERLAEPAPHYQFDRFFRGQPVRVITRSGNAVPGVVAARSVHLDDDRTYRSTSSDNELFVDIGASSPEEVRAAGVDRLDRLTLEKRFFRLGKSPRISAPWVSSRSGAAILLRLAEAIKQSPPAARVTLAFAAQQFYYHHGLARLLQRVEADRIILLRPGGGDRPAITAVTGWSSQLADELRAKAKTLGYRFEQSSAEPLDFGPFRTDAPWKDSEQGAVVTMGVENAGTPVEVVDVEALDQVAHLLAALSGVSWNKEQNGLAADLESSGGSKAADGDGVVRQGREANTRLPNLIEQLTEVPGVSGTEEAVRTRIQTHLPPELKERTSLDEKGNLIVRLGKDGPPRAIFIAHMDEIGFQVDRIKTDGRLAVKSVGGISTDLFTWRPVVVHGEKGQVPGIMMQEDVVDVGARSEDELAEMGVGIGSTLTVPKRMRRLAGERATARSFDDRIGCAVLLDVLQSLESGRRRGGAPLWVVFGVEEEIGLVGAEFMAEATEVKRVYPVDSFVTSDSPLEDRRLADAPLGKGFVIRALDTSGITPRAEVDRVVRLARKREIPVQYGVTAGGNDGSTFVPYGAVNVPLSWPLRYAHTAGEVADLRDIEALRRIIEELVLEELAGGSGN